MEYAADQLQSRCEVLVPQILAGYGWALVTERQISGFRSQVAAETARRVRFARDRSLDKVIRDATVNLYGFVWYNGCREDGTARQSQAFEELYNEFYRKIRQHYSDLPVIAVEEVAQQCLIDAWHHLDDVRDAGSLVEWIRQIALHAVQKYLEREQRYKMMSLEENEGGEGTSPHAEVLISPPQASIQPSMDQADYHLEYQKLETAIRECLTNSFHQEIVVGRFLRKRAVKELAVQFGRTANAVSTEMGRALKKLRECSGVVEHLEAMMERWIKNEEE